MFRIGDIIGFPGKGIQGDWKVGTYDTGDPASLKISIHSSVDEGLRILLASGPEYSSELAETAIDTISANLDPNKMKGTLISIHGFAPFLKSLRKLYQPIFPGWHDGDNVEKITFSIFDEIIQHVDYAIFLDGPEDAIISLPHAAVYSMDDTPTMSCHPEIIKMMGHDLIIEKRGSRGMLAIEASRIYGVPILIASFDETQSNSESLDYTCSKVLNFLAHAGVIDAKPIMPNRTYVATEDGEVRASVDGETVFANGLNEYIHAGDKAVKIQIENSDRSQSIESDKNGYIVRRRKQGKVTADDLLYSILEADFLRTEPIRMRFHTVLENSESDEIVIRPNNLFKSTCNP